jgi:uncharacterized protein
MINNIPILEFHGKQKTFYFDEIQNIAGWERFVRRLHDEGNKIYLTGSNANLLSRELGTHLTGRHIQIELFPFSFKEYLKFKNISWDKINIHATEKKIEIQQLFNEYLTHGGFPQYIKDNNVIYLKSLYDSILYRDVMVRNKLTNDREIQELMYYLASNLAKPFSYNKLKTIIGVKHVNTVRNYVNFIDNTYLIQQISKFDYSLNKQAANAKKVYFIDNSISKRLAFQNSENHGRFLENLVFISLRRKYKQIYYYLNKKECDFVVKNESELVGCYQVCHELNEQNRAREFSGAIACAKELGLNKAIVLTMYQQEHHAIDDIEIEVIPLWSWLLFA